MDTKAPQQNQEPETLKDALPVMYEKLRLLDTLAPPTTIDGAARQMIAIADIVYYLGLGTVQMRDWMEQRIQRMKDIAVPAEKEAEKRDVIEAWTENLASYDTAFGLQPRVVVSPTKLAAALDLSLQRNLSVLAEAPEWTTRLGTAGSAAALAMLGPMLTNMANSVASYLAPLMSAEPEALVAEAAKVKVESGERDLDERE